MHRKSLEDYINLLIVVILRVRICELSLSVLFIFPLFEFLQQLCIIMNQKKLKFKKRHDNKMLLQKVKN